MDVLDPTRRSHRANRRTACGMGGGLLVAMLLASIVSSCLLSDGPPRTRFDHQIHTVAIGLDCTVCHAGARSTDRAGLPSAATCKPCHGHETAGGDTSGDTVIPMFFDDAYRARQVAATSAPREIRFSHRYHVVEQKLDCVGCHGDVGTGNVVTADARVTMDECIECHRGRGKDNACTDCHSEVDRSWKPPSHYQGWERSHGAVVRAGPRETADRCSLCHDEASSCKACHARAEPRDHTNFWRIRGHGIEVAVDRSRCATCHRSDFCTRCHESTPPISHAAGWGAPQDRHCTQCHFPLSANGCATCHKHNRSHDLATPMPPWHVPSMNCRGCHGRGVRLPHADGGQVCTSCHH